MFSSNGQPNGKEVKNGNLNGGSINIIGEGTVIKGDITCESDLRIDGKITGTVISKAKLVIGNTGHILGDMNCANADISGKVDGKVNVKELLFLKGSSVIDGTITTGKLIIESGAVFNGECNMGNKAKNESAERETTIPLKKQASV